RISAVFVTLKNDLRAVEQDIANAGEQYNRQVKAYNAYYDQAVPNVIATLFKLKKLAECEMQVYSIEE
ncbi:MAG: LemA family protein, partial [Clostridia bacterium]|nr:LemA family protein [Clostridia bacterium]